MVNLIVNEIVTILENNLSFVDKITGIVKTAELSDAEGNIKTFPIAYNTNPTTCNDSELLDYVPDSTKMSIIYFEDRGSSVTGCDQNSILWRASFTLVCWFNYKLIDEDMIDSALITANIIKYLPGNMGNIPPLTAVLLDVSGQQPNDGSVFAKYSYSEPISQYITYPYGYVALDLTADFRLRTDCIEDIILNPAECL